MGFNQPVAALEQLRLFPLYRDRGAVCLSDAGLPGLCGSGPFHLLTTISALSRSSVISYAVGAIVLGGCLLLVYIPPKTEWLAGPLALSSPLKYFDSYDTANLFGFPVLWAVVQALLWCALSGVCVWLAQKVYHRKRRVPMMLWRGEMKKTLMTQRGIWVLLVCLVLKLAFLCAFPEQKDRRIVLSQKQYDKYLDQLSGRTPGRSPIGFLAEYKTCKEVKDSQEAMQGEVRQGRAHRCTMGGLHPGADPGGFAHQLGPDFRGEGGAVFEATRGYSACALHL